VFFDEMMRTVPPKYSATFVSLAQSMEYLSRVAAPLAGTLLADQIGLGGALRVKAALRLLGFAMFAWGKSVEPARQTVKPSVAIATQPSEAGK